MGKSAPLDVVPVMTLSPVLAVLLSAGVAGAVPNEPPRATTTWTATNNLFADDDAFRAACGTHHDPGLRALTPVRSITEAEARRMAGLAPDAAFAPTFDSRTQWPKCAGVIGHIRDQGMATCGSCFVFGPVTALQDKWCIKSGGNTSWGNPRHLLSVQDGLACGGSGTCSGGDPLGVMGYLASTGEYDRLQASFLAGLRCSHRCQAW